MRGIADSVRARAEERGWEREKEREMKGGD